MIEDPAGRMTVCPSFSLERIIEAHPSELFEAFTEARALKEWLCDEAVARAHAGGALCLWWRDETFACGRFHEVNPDVRIVLSLQRDPGCERIRMTASFEPLENATRLRVGLSTCGEAVASPGIEDFWSRSLDRLVQVWGERRIDPRIARRPDGAPRASLGFFYGPGIPAAAASLPPGRRGIEVVGTLEETSAHVAGLRKGDAVIEVDGVPVFDRHSFSAALDLLVAEQNVTVRYVRSGAIRETTVRTGRVPEALPLPPANAKELAEQIEEHYGRFEKELDDILVNVSEETASQRPDPGSWSVKEVLAHLIPFERMFHNWLGATTSGLEMLHWVKHPRLWTDGLLEVYPTLAALRGELRRARAETIAYIRRLPDDLTRRPTYRRLGMMLLLDQFHPPHHHRQIRRILETLDDSSPTRQSTRRTP